MIAGGPKRSSIQPCSGPSTPLSARASEKAPETIARLQPNSSRSSAA